MLISAVIIFMFLMGCSIILLSSLKVIKKDTDALNVFFSRKESKGSIILSILIQYLTAVGLVTGSAGIYFGITWGLSVSLFALVALVYISLKGLSWRLDNRSDIPKYIGFAGGAVSLIILIQIFK